MAEERSKLIQEYVAGDYYVTAAQWVPVLGSRTFEIGIRHIASGKFWLMQGDWDVSSVQDVANAVAKLLGSETECYTPEWCQEHFK